MSVPYENATSGVKARDEIVTMLRKFGCESVGFMDDFEDQSVMLAFRHRGRPVQLKASAKGWAVLFLKEHPHNWSRMKSTEQQHEAKALAQGLVAINSILRDWVKGQITAVECGIMSFEAVFLPHMLTKNGRSVVDEIMARDILPALEGPEAAHGRD